MVILRLLSRAALWGLAWLLLAQAWMSTASASAFDNRVPWGMASCGVAWLLGTLLVRPLVRLLPGRFRRLDATRHGLSLIVLGLCAHALSHAGADMSIRIVREEIPRIFAPLFPFLTGLAPLLLAAGVSARSAGRQAVLLAVFATSLGGALFLLEPASAAGLGLVALLLVAAASGPPDRIDRLLLPGALFVVLAAVSTARGHSLLAALPSLTWILALGALGLAIALAEGGAQLWRDVLGSATLAAVAVALCGVALTIWLGRHVEWESALATRLVLFRQHPNFLAPFFGLHTVLAAGLALRRSPMSVAWLLAAVLLAASTFMTDSNTGIASMGAGLLVLPSCWLLRALTRRVPALWLLAAAVLLPVLAGGAWYLQGGEQAAARLTSGIDRFEKSMEFRVDAWRNSMAVIQRYPWLGVGPHTFIAVDRFRPGSRFFNEPESPHPHNMLLYVAQAAGLPALAVVLVWCAWLLLRCWGAFRSMAPELPAALPAAVLAGSVSLLLASLFDLGLSLETVVPAPIFLFTGLLAARRQPVAQRAPAWPRPISAIAWSVGLGLLVLQFSVQPLRAQELALKAQLMLWEGQQEDQPARLQDAREAMASAVAIAPTTPRAHDLLSRWLEQAGDLAAAQRVLSQMVALAPRDATGHSLLGHLYLRHGMFELAATELGLALQDFHGSLQENRDRADRIACFAALGRRDTALELLVDALALDSGVIPLLPWQDAEPGNFHLPVKGAAPIALESAAEMLFGRHVGEHGAGREVGRRAWLDTYRVFRVARRDDRAADVLDWLEKNLRPGVIEPETLASERAQLALDAGDLDVALAHFQHAFEVSHNPYFEYRIAEIQHQQGVTVPPSALGQEALTATGEILDQPQTFRDVFRNEADAEAARGRPLAAAEALERTLTFEDDLLSRAHVRVRVAELELRGGQPAASVETLRQACADLSAKPFPWTTLQEGATSSLPARVAAGLVEAWRVLGLDRDGRQHAAWGLPDFFSPRQGPSLLRLAFYQLNAQVDQLLREAELQILADPQHLPALWARLFALEAAGRHLELGGAMRAVVDAYTAGGASAERQYAQLEAVMRERLRDPRAWEQLALLTMLRGKYREAKGMYGSARQLLLDDQVEEARLCSWQAMAAFLASEPGEARRILREALALQPDDEFLRLRLSVIPEELGP